MDLREIGVYRVLVEKPEGKRPLGRPRRRWEDRIKIELREGCVEWILLAWHKDRWRPLVNTVMNLLVLGPRIGTGGGLW
jgi:hypothetical protein